MAEDADDQQDGDWDAALALSAVLSRPMRAGQDRPFDDLVRVAAFACDVPFASISLFDQSGPACRTCPGDRPPSLPRSASLCAAAAELGEIIVVPDLRDDPRFEANPLVTGPPRLRFYAGLPLVDRDGETFGVLCLLDRKPRHDIGAAQMIILHDVADRVSCRLGGSRSRASLADRTSQLELLYALGELLDRPRETGPPFGEVASLLVRDFADACLIDVFEAGGASLRRVAVGRREGLSHLFMRHSQPSPPLHHPAHPISLCARTGRPELRTLVDDAWLASIATSDAHLQALRLFAPESFICVPLRSGGRPVGVLGLTRAKGSVRLYDHDDLAAAIEMGRQLGAAVGQATDQP